MEDGHGSHDGGVPNPHTPQQDRLFSNIGHWIEGAIISAAGLSSLRLAMSDDARHDRHQANVLIGAGSVLGVGLVAGSFHHGGPVTFFKADMQQRQHLQMSGLITAAGLLRRAGRAGALLSSVPVGAVGQMFLSHEQHGSDDAAARAKERHDLLGKTILAGAALGALGDLTRWRWIRALAGAAMVGAGAQLLTYREPQGAYERGEGNGHM